MNLLNCFVGMDWICSQNLYQEQTSWAFTVIQWQCLQVNITRPHSWLVNIGSGNGLVPSGNNPLPEPMLTQNLVTIWRQQATMSQAHDCLYGYCPLIFLTRPQWVKHMIVWLLSPNLYHLTCFTISYHPAGKVPRLIVGQWLGRQFQKLFTLYQTKNELLTTFYGQIRTSWPQKEYSLILLIFFTGSHTFSFVVNRGLANFAESG